MRGSPLMHFSREGQPRRLPGCLAPIVREEPEKKKKRWGPTNSRRNIMVEREESS